MPAIPPFWGTRITECLALYIVTVWVLCFGTCSYHPMLSAAKWPLITKDLENMFVFLGHQGSCLKCKRQIVVPYGNTLGSKICQIIRINYILYHFCIFAMCHGCLLVSKSVIPAREYEMKRDYKDLTAVSQLIHLHWTQSHAYQPLVIYLCLVCKSIQVTLVSKIT